MRSEGHIQGVRRLTPRTACTGLGRCPLSRLEWDVGQPRRRLPGTWRPGALSEQQCLSLAGDGTAGQLGLGCAACTAQPADDTSVYYRGTGTPRRRPAPTLQACLSPPEGRWPGCHPQACPGLQEAPFSLLTRRPWENPGGCRTILRGDPRGGRERGPGSPSGEPCLPASTSVLQGTQAAGAQPPRWTSELRPAPVRASVPLGAPIPVGAPRPRECPREGFCPLGCPPSPWVPPAPLGAPRPRECSYLALLPCPTRGGGGPSPLSITAHPSKPRGLLPACSAPRVHAHGCQPLRFCGGWGWGWGDQSCRPSRPHRPWELLSRV